MGQLPSLQALSQSAAQTVDALRSANLAEYLESGSATTGRSVHVLTSHGVVAARRVLLIVSGMPDAAGVWCYALVQLERRDEAWMQPYFERGRRPDWGSAARLRRTGTARIGVGEV